MKLKMKSPDMGAKRGATTELNHTNWDQEEQPEEMGLFKAATTEELQTRVIKKARRKLPGNNEESDSADSASVKTIFSGFSGFGKNATASTVTIDTTWSSPFSFLSQISSTSEEKSEENKPEEQDKKPDEKEFDFEKSKTYYAKLKGLNLDVSNWIKKHVDTNALCILTPIFNDYEKYLKEIQNEQKSTSDSAKTTPSALFSFGISKNATSASNTPEKSTSQFNFISGETIANVPPPEVDTKKPATFLFGSTSKVTSPTTTSGTMKFSTPAYSFGQKSTDDKPSTITADKRTVFTCSSPSPFVFANVAKPGTVEKDNNGDDKNNDEDDEEDQPPKVEFKPVVEDDSIYSKKCKVFVKTANSYADHGVGTLHLKPVKDSDKTQLIVRADTSLGNILVNIILSSAVPTQRLGKNNVMMVCVPKPDDDKPIPILLRVKTSEEADELLEKIDEYKK